MQTLTYLAIGALLIIAAGAGVVAYAAWRERRRDEDAQQETQRAGGKGEE